MEDKVIVTLKGKPIITQKDLEEEKEQWSQDPQLQADEDESEPYLGSLAFVQNCLKFLIRDRIVDEYVLHNKINETSEYQEGLRKAIHNLYRKILEETIHVPITEDELRILHEQWASGRPFEEDRKMLEKYIRVNKFPSYLEKKIEELKQEFDVKINEDLVK